jgi:hypothetical protein
MIVAHRKKFMLTSANPLLTGVCLALWTVTIPAGAVRGGFVPALQALIAMSAERRGPAALDSHEHFELCPSQRLTIALNESASRLPNNIGHLERWSRHDSPSFDSGVGRKLLIVI